MLYKSSVWSRDGTRIIGVRYFLIDKDKEIIEQIKRGRNPKNLDELLAHLQYMNIPVEEVEPIPLDI